LSGGFSNKNELLKQDHFEVAKMLNKRGLRSIVRANGIIYQFGFNWGVMGGATLLI
jgi:hypothetical protein